VQLKIAELANTQTYLFEHFTFFKLSQLVLDFGSNTSQTTGRRQSSNKQQADDKNADKQQADDKNADNRKQTSIRRQSISRQTTNDKRQNKQQMAINQ
jgi:hypothetical protein